MIKDSVNADAQTIHYKKIIKPIKAGDTINIKMVATAAVYAVLELVK
jgi:alpha-glucosidase